MGKFIKTAKDKIMVKVNIGGLGDTWATCTPAVKDFAKKTFKEGDAVKVTYNEQTGAETKYHVTRIEKGTEADINSGSSTPDTGSGGKPKCKDCGKELKDAKYEKCYTCNQKNPSKSKKSYGKTPEEQDSIKRQAIGKMTAQSLIAMQGQVDPNNIVGLIETLYAKYKELVG